jgi:ABC-2 type transport system permease protein
VKVLAFAGTALRRFVRERSNVFFVFILPIGIILLVGVQFGGDVRPVVGVHLEEGAGPVGAEIVRRLDEGDRVTVRSFDDEEDLVRAVEQGSVSAGIDLPGDLGQALAAGATAEVGFVARTEGSGPQLEVVVQQAVADATAPVAAARAAVALGVDPAEAQARVEQVQPAVPTIAVDTGTTGESLFAGVTGRFDLGAAGQLVLFTFLTGLTGASELILNRQLGLTRRTLGTPTGTGTLIAGEGLGRLVVPVVQALYILVATLLLFRVDWGDPVAAGAIILALSAVGAGAAMLMGAVFRNDAQAGGIAIILGIGLAAIGGCMLPLELYGDTMRRIAFLTPHAWALDAFAETVRRDGTVVDILPQLGVLAVFAAVLLVLASWQMRRVISRV